MQFWTILFSNLMQVLIQSSTNSTKLKQLFYFYNNFLMKFCLHVLASKKLVTHDLVCQEAIFETWKIFNPIFSHGH